MFREVGGEEHSDSHTDRGWALTPQQGETTHPFHHGQCRGGARPKLGHAGTSVAGPGGLLSISHVCEHRHRKPGHAHMARPPWLNTLRLLSVWLHDCASAHDMPPLTAPRLQPGEMHGWSPTTLPRQRWLLEPLRNCHSPQKTATGFDTRATVCH